MGLLPRQFRYCSWASLLLSCRPRPPRPARPCPQSWSQSGHTYPKGGPTEPATGVGRSVISSRRETNPCDVKVAAALLSGEDGEEQSKGAAGTHTHTEEATNWRGEARSRSCEEKGREEIMNALQVRDCGKHRRGEGEGGRVREFPRQNAARDRAGGAVVCPGENGVNA